VTELLDHQPAEDIVAIYDTLEVTPLNKWPPLKHIATELKRPRGLLEDVSQVNGVAANFFNEFLQTRRLSALPILIDDGRDVLSPEFRAKLVDMQEQIDRKERLRIADFLFFAVCFLHLDDRLLFRFAQLPNDWGWLTRHEGELETALQRTRRLTDFEKSIKAEIEGNDGARIVLSGRVDAIQKDASRLFELKMSRDTSKVHEIQAGLYHYLSVKNDMMMEGTDLVNIRTGDRFLVRCRSIEKMEEMIKRLVHNRRHHVALPSDLDFREKHAPLVARWALSQDERASLVEEMAHLCL